MMTAEGRALMVRVEMWCAREWTDAREGGLTALAAGDLKAYQHCRQEEQDWFGAMLVVNRLILGIEPLTGDRFLDEESPRRRVG